MRRFVFRDCCKTSVARSFDLVRRRLVYREMRIAYLHAGLHKTGTSTLQEFTRENADLLFEYGVKMPSFNGERRYFHRNLALEAGEAPGFDPRLGGFEHLAKEIDETDKDVFISQEIFSSRIADPEVLQRLKEFFAQHGCRLHVIGYVRNQPEYLNSRYGQSTKRLYTHWDFGTYIDKALGDKNHDLGHVFGPALADPDIDVTIKHFDSCIATGLEWSLMDVLLPGGYDRARFKPAEKKNEALHPKALFLARLVTRELQQQGREREQYHVRKTRDVAEKQGWTGVKFCGLTPELVAKIEAFYRDSNEGFARRVWGTAWPVVSRRLAEVNEVVEANLSAEELGKLTRLAQRIVKRSEGSTPKGVDKQKKSFFGALWERVRN